MSSDAGLDDPVLRAGARASHPEVPPEAAGLEVCHYFEFSGVVTGGIRASVDHQRRMMELAGVEYTGEPRLDVDVLHLNLMGPRSIVWAERARRRGTPVVIHTHATAEDFRESFRFSNALARPLRPYLEVAYGLGDVLVCPSEYNRRLIETYADAETVVVTNGVDAAKLEGFASLREEYLRRWDLSPPVVFQVGHVIKRKGLATFVETARRMPGVDFAWVGPLDFPLKGRPTRALIEASPDNCTFTGYVDDVRAAYAVGDVFFCPTREENEGIALLEAMTAGKPVLVRDIEAFSWLEDGVDCLKATRRFDAAIDRLCDPDLRERLGANAARRAESFALDRVAGRLASVYAAVA
ncbi:MAG TPA: glycosyltransferase family 4 protein [Halobacteriales archaeon]|nr:glycosyltransferase family 4 protein [Halobacteriales archaeon]